MFCQCLWYALNKWALDGGGILLVASVHWFIPHVLHRDTDGQITHFVPIGDLKKPWHSVFGFYGVIEIGDKDAAKRGCMTPTGMFFGTAILFIEGGVWAAYQVIKYLRSQTWTGYRH